MLNPAAGSISADVERRLREGLPDHTPLRVEEERRLPEALRGAGVTRETELVVAGGDGTISSVVRCVERGQLLGIVATGTYNNFARSLGLPTDLDAGIEAVRSGVPRPVALGRAGDHIFLEAAAIGIFGDALALGEAVKGQEYGDVWERLRTVAGQGPFRYRITGSLQRSGRTYTVIIANTPSTGSLLPLGQTTPREPELELVFRGGPNRVVAAARLIGSFIRRRHRQRTWRIREVTIESDPPMHVYADLERVGETPVVIAVVPDALHVIVPR